jgi:hypothetical protein
VNPAVSVIPEELMLRLHEATEGLYAARHDVERAMAGFDYRHQERVNQAEHRFHETEHRLEQLDQEIDHLLHPRQSG